MVFIYNMDPYSFVKEKLDCLEYLIRNQVNDDTMNMLQLLSEIKSSVKTVYVNQQMNVIHDAQPESMTSSYMSEFDRAEVFDQTNHSSVPVSGVESSLSQTGMPVYENASSLYFNTTSPISDDMPLYTNRDLVEIKIDSDLFHKVEQLKALMRKNQMDTRLLDEVDGYLKPLIVQNELS